MNHPYSILCQQTEQWIIAFYGYGQNGSVYSPLKKIAGDRYNIVVVDLVYTAGGEEETKLEFVHFMEKLLSELKIKRFIGLSYSMGSRYNLLLAELMPQRLQQLILVAPDGIRRPLWSPFATNTWIGKALFHFFVHHEHAYLNLIRLCYQSGWIPKQVYAFTKWHMRDRACRLKVYTTWMNMRHIVPDLNRISEAQQLHKFDIISFFGKRDSVIGSSVHQKLKKRVPGASVVLLDEGHDLLNESFFTRLNQEFLYQFQR
jgi:pimeloyl-ACP methyl ester carboxylesterase